MLIWVMRYGGKDHLLIPTLTVGAVRLGQQLRQCDGYIRDLLSGVLHFDYYNDLQAGQLWET